MATRGEINSNFYKIVNVDGNGSPTTIKPEYVPAGGNVTEVQYNDSGLLEGNSNFTYNASTDTLIVGNVTANITGTVANANYAAYAGNITINAQPNITSTGSLTGLTVSNVTGVVNFTTTANVTLGDVSNLHIAGGSLGQVLRTDGAGNLSWVTGGGGGGTPGGSNTYVQFNDGGTFNGVANLTFDKTTNILAATNFSGNGALLTNLTGGNVVGDVSGANHANVADVANSVAVGNVSGIGNIATINLDGSSSNVLYGNGVFATITIPSGNEISNGTSNVNIPVANGNVNTSVGGVANVFVVTTTGANVVGNLHTTANITGNSLQLNTSTGVTVANIGAMFWDEASNTVTLGMNYGVQQQIGLESYVLVKASATITDGQAVMFTGANGNHVTAAPADTTSVGFRSEYIIGIATQSIATNDFGYITVLGIVRGIDTNAFNVGDILWVSNSTVGGLTATRPSDPNFQIEVGAVTKKSVGDGHIQVRVTAFNKIDDLTDVTITSPAIGQALIYNSSNLWVNGTPANATHANTANTVVDNAQPNITSTGTLVSLGVTGNITAGNINGGNLVTANFFSGNGSLLTSLTGGNVTGQVGNALVAGTVYTNSQPNITSTGSLTGLTVSNATGVVNFTTTANVTLGAIGNLHISGGSSGQYLTTDGAGNLSFTTGSGGTPSQIANGTSNVNIATSGGAVTVAVGGANTVTFNSTSSNFTGNLGMTANTILTSNTELSFGESGDTYGQMYLRMQNRNGQAGPLVDGSLGTQGAIVDLGFKVSGPVTRNIRMETRAGANLTGGPEFQFGVAASPGFYVGDNITIANGTTVSTSTTSGAFQVKGGAGVAGNIYIGGNANVTGIANVTGNVIAPYFIGNGSQLTGLPAGGSTTQVQYNNAGALAGMANVTFAAGNLTLGPVGNVKLTGGTNGYFLQTDGAGNISWVAGGGSGNGTVGGSNTQVQFNDSGVFGGVANLTFDKSTNTLTTTNFTAANVSTVKYNEAVIAGGSVSGTITPNVAAGTIFNYTLTGNITLNALANSVAGSGCTVILTQGGSGSYTLTSSMKYAGGTKTLSTAVGAIDIVSVFYDGTTYYATLAKGFA